ncbi:oxalate/formate MFS antiporter [Acinetobacter sp. ESL0695]|uniref:oxalate/formate MFS antiporter n=1 Tax=Acinetobacter sp. ESL0695 TaxID=2983215 RepID=UPI0023F02625|nr:oxalate/formate MFS antiporter [Acinetobacter sp. ESL0695]WEV49827.1 oxalate/formate MFS antiporter [Acinetobacter sp. ESL0695]
MMIIKQEKWLQLILAIICMGSISSAQYVWTLLTQPFMHKLGIQLPSLQVTFALFIIFQTFFAPFQGKLIDKFGPKRLIALGVVLSGLSWVFSSQASSLIELYLIYGCIGGLSTGIVYIGTIGLMVKWFPERRGFATGMVAAGYGIGAVVTTFPIHEALLNWGLDKTLIVFGIIFSCIGLLASLRLKTPQITVVQHIQQSQYQFNSKEMIKQPLFWLMFVMMTMMSTSGLMVTSQMASFSESFGVSHTMVFGMAALPLALSLDRVMNGITRPLFGFVSDICGREITMFVAFALEGIAMFVWLLCRHDPVLFILLSGIVFFGWGEIFSLFPATLTDTFGTQHATANYGWLYLSQGIGSIFGGPFAALLFQYTQDWSNVFYCAIFFDLITAFIAIIILKPWRYYFMNKYKKGYIDL